nr:serine/arginine-rich splicing factor RS2Z32-like [Leptinotarsa decemlineata]
MAATVTLGKDDASILIEDEYLRVGIVRCWIERRLKVDRCYQCSKYGHTSSKCRGPNLAKHCYKCGEEGYHLKECNNKEACPVCRTKGHKAGTMKCPEFKNALTIARRDERKQKTWRGARKINITDLVKKKAEKPEEMPDQELGGKHTEKEEHPKDMDQYLKDFSDKIGEAQMTLDAIDN